MPRPMKELAEVEHRVATLYASLELSQSTWLVTSLSPGSVTMSKHLMPAGDGPGLLSLLARLRTKAEQVAGAPVEIVVIQEAGLDGFWVHRLLEANRIESYVVDAASIAVPRRRRRAKTMIESGHHVALNPRGPEAAAEAPVGNDDHGQ
jgi:transposase